MPLVGRFFRRSLYLAVPLALLVSASARAQEPLPPPAYIAAVEGIAVLERDDEATPAVMNMPLVPRDRVRTDAGRVEIRFPDGTGIAVAEFSAIELVTETRVRLLGGSIDRLEPLQPSVNAISASYLPQDLKMYGSTFDQYGSWRYAPDYGYVWYPMVVAGWQPYYYGYWEPVRRYGWTWIGSDVWAWPTHHYGRWGHRSGAWFWVPDRTFASAWVSWGSAPGYVSWCPLGFDNRPVFAAPVGGGAYWPGWTVVSRTHFGARGLYVNRYAVDARRLPHTTFTTQPVPAVAVPRNLPRHVTDGVTPSPGVAVPRDDRAFRPGAFESRRSPVTVRPPVQTSAQPAPIVIPPVVSGQPVRAGTGRSAYEQRREIQEHRPTASEARPQFPEQRPAAREAQPRFPEQRPASREDRPQLHDRPAANDQRPRFHDERPTTNDRQPTTNERRRSTNDQRPQAAPPQASQPRSAPSGEGRHERAGAPAQPRGGNNNGSNTNNGESRGAARRRG